MRTGPVPSVSPTGGAAAERLRLAPASSAPRGHCRPARNSARPSGRNRPRPKPRRRQKPDAIGLTIKRAKLTYRGKSRHSDLPDRPRPPQYRRRTAAGVSEDQLIPVILRHCGELWHFRPRMVNGFVKPGQRRLAATPCSMLEKANAIFDDFRDLAGGDEFARFDRRARNLGTRRGPAGERLHRARNARRSRADRAGPACRGDADRQSARHHACAPSRPWPPPMPSSPRTRAFRARLLAHYGMTTPLVAYHEHNAARRCARISWRGSPKGAALALISDAGTPLVSDPGYKLVAEALAAGIAVTSVPGPSAVLAALVVRGPADRPVFLRRLPAAQERGPARAAQRARIRAGDAGVLRIAATARRNARRSRRRTRRPAGGGRARTDQVLRDDAARRPRRTCGAFCIASAPPKGEIVVSVGPPAASAPVGDRRTRRLLRRTLETLSVKDAAAAVSAQTGAPRRQVYARALILARRQTLNGPAVRQIRAEAAGPSVRVARRMDRRRLAVVKGYRVLARRFAVERRRDRYRRAGGEMSSPSSR